ncbi:MAG: conjugal transfer protein TraX [Clostridia bacterium]|nr:conjugal transfer protein TraX [Clostridia bacterium]
MKKCLDSNVIKLIAILAMTADHLAWMLFPGYPREPLPLLLHTVGRVTCPIMCYFIAEGYHYTRDVGKYTRRLFLFALLSHFAYLFGSPAFEGWRSFVPFSSGRVLNQTSVMWSLAWGLVMLRVIHSQRIRRDGIRTLLVLLICAVSFPADWSCIASLCILAFGTNRGRFGAQMGWMIFYVAIYSAVYCLALDPLYGLLQMAVILAIPILALYNGERGKNPRVNRVMKWLFYLYYPLHLLAIGLLGMFL